MQAQHCRELAQGAADLKSREILLAIAEDFEAAARFIDGQEPEQMMPPPVQE